MDWKKFCKSSFRSSDDFGNTLARIDHPAVKIVSKFIPLILGNGFYFERVVPNKIKGNGIGHFYFPADKAIAHNFESLVPFAYK